jgi:hypothetical protein
MLYEHYFTILYSLLQIKQSHIYKINKMEKTFRGGRGGGFRGLIETPSSRGRKPNLSKTCRGMSV